MITYNGRYFFHLLIQSLAAIIFMFLVLYSLDKVLATNLIWAAGASTLASSAYIVFGSPHIPSAQPHRILFGYLIAMVCGYFLQFLSNDTTHLNYFYANPTYQRHVFEVAAALSVGLSFILMLLLRCSHPPAAGLAVVMVLEISNFKAIAVISLGALLLVLIRWIFAKQLRPLI